MYNVYILYSEEYNKIYIGYTSDLSNRILSHNVLATKGWTVRFRPWKLIYKEEFNNKAEALLREKQLKGAKARKWIWENLISKG